MRFSRRISVCAAVVALLTSVLQIEGVDAGLGDAPATITVQSPETVFIVDDPYTLRFAVGDDDEDMGTTTGELRAKPYDQAIAGDDGSEIPTYTYEHSGSSAQVRQKFPLSPGWSACFPLSNSEGSEADPIPCFGAPVDDAELKRSGTWKRRVANGHYLNTFSLSKTKGASLRLGDAYFSHVAIIVTTCRGCGDIKILIDGSKLDRVSLDDHSRKKQQLVYQVATKGLIHGTIKVEVATKDLPVKIDGIGVIERNVIFPV